ncbi:MAG: hypothetical protein IJZ32_04720 [Clostridia bacterium]|nr:hypothetical protein [Clostridia bacterium]
MKKKIEDFNPTIRAIYAYLQKELADGAKYISYYVIGRNITPARSWRTVSYSIDKLVYHGFVFIRNGRLSLK